MKYKLIAVEGVDGTGKTTITRLLAKEFKGKYFYTPPIIIRFLKNFMDRHAPIKIRCIYYLAGNWLSSLILPFYIRKTTVFCDWYYFSTIAYHSVLMKKNLKEPKLLKPDVVIYLSADWEVVEKRLSERKEKSKYENMEFLKKVDIKYREMLEDFQKVIYVDTSFGDTQAIIRKIKEELNS